MTNKILAYVCEDLAAEVLLGWQDCKKLGILPPNFPSRVNHVTSDEISSKAYRAVTEHVPPEECRKLQNKLLERYSEIIRDDLQGKVIKDAELKIRNKKDADVKPLRVATPRATPLHLK